MGVDLALWSVLLLLASPCVLGNLTDVESVRKKWGAKDVIRDIEHVKEDIKKIAELQDTGALSVNEALFYFVRMHDFDDNEKMDGLEFMVAMKHTHEHQHEENPHIPEMELDQLTAVVDTLFAYDDDQDGFISYSELRTHAGKQ